MQINDLCYIFCTFFLLFNLCPITKSLKLLISRGSWAHPQPGDRVPQIQALNLLENRIINMSFRPLYPVQHQWLPEGDQIKGQKLEQASNTLEQLLHIMAQNQKFSQGLHKPLQLLKSRSRFGEITTNLLDHR